MKKFFALLCVMAMVMSLFSGIVLAVPAAYVELSADEIIYAEDEVYEITGTVSLDGDDVDSIFDFAVYDGETKIVDGQVVKGKFAFELVCGEDITVANKELTVTFDNYSEGYVVEDQTIVVRYDVAINEDLSLEYGDDEVLVSGKLVDANGKVVKNLTEGNEITIVGATIPAGTKVPLSGYFAFELDNVVGNADGEVVLSIGGVEYKTWDVATQAFETVTVKPGTTIHTVTATKLTFEAFETEDDEDEDILATGVEYTLSGVRMLVGADEFDKINDEDSTSYATVMDDEDEVIAKKYSKIVLVDDTDDITVTFLASGTLKVAAENAGYEGSATVTVNKPEALNVIGLPTSEITIGTKVLSVELKDEDGKAYVKADAADVEIKAAGPGFTKVKSVVFNEATNKWDITVAPTQAGTITLTFNVDGEVVTKEVKVGGYTVELSHSEVVVGTTNDITVTVLDASGNPVNRALVELGTKKVDGRYKNISNGVYLFDDAKWTAVGELDLKVTVYTWDEDLEEETSSVKANITGALEVLGEVVYTVTVDQTQVKAGEDNDLVITVTDVDGNKVSALVAVTVDDDFFANATRQSNGTYKIKDVNAVETIEIKASTDSGKKIGEATVEVLMPVVTADVTALTDGFQVPVTIKVADPITGEALDVKLVVDEEENVAVTYENDDEEFEFNGTEDSEFVIDVLATIADDDEEAYVTFNVDLGGVEIPVEFKLPVKAAQISVTPNSLILDANNAVVVTALDADGKPLAEKVVKYMNTEIGETADNGTLLYSVRPAASGKVTFAIERDDVKIVDEEEVAKYDEVEVTVGQDTVVPVITLDKTADTTKAETYVVTGKVTDNVKVARVVVNGIDAYVIPGAQATFEATVALKAGENKVRVVAFDANGMAAEAYMTVTRELPTVVMLALNSADATINGQPAGGVAPYLKGNSAMVPFRFIGEALGAYVEYANNAGVQTVTLSLEGTTVVLTIGSNVAMVNGVATTMPVAPEVTNGRTMVPLRFVGEALGAYVEFNPVNSGITVLR